MSSTIEDRLVAALEARAELVTPQDLRPLEVPATPRRHARAGVLLLAAAATIAVVATPFVLEGGGDLSPEPGPAGPPSVGVSEPAEPEPTEPSDTPTVPTDAVVVGRQKADVDGDGRPDRVRLLLQGSDPENPSDGFVEVSLATGATGVAEVPFGYPGPLKPAFDINDDGREQVLLSHTEGGDAASLLVYTWQDGGLVLARRQGDAPLAVALDGQGAAAGYYTDDRGLTSWSRLDPVGGSTYQVEEWSWSVDGDRLVSTPAGRGCVDVTTDDPPQPC